MRLMNQSTRVGLCLFAAMLPALSSAFAQEHSYAGPPAAAVPGPEWQQPGWPPPQQPVPPPPPPEPWQQQQQPTWQPPPQQTWQPVPPPPMWQPPPQEISPPPEPKCVPCESSPAPARPRSGARLRLEVGLEGGFIGASTAVGQSLLNAGGGGGLYLRLGTQWSDRFALQVEGSVTTLIFINYARGAVTANFTALRRLTLSLGPVVGGMAAYGGGTTSYAGVTLRADIHLLQRLTASGRRHSLTLGLGGDLGLPFQNSQYYAPFPSVAGGGMFNIGYTLH